MSINMLLWKAGWRAAPEFSVMRCWFRGLFYFDNIIWRQEWENSGLYGKMKSSDRFEFGGDNYHGYN